MVLSRSFGIESIDSAVKSVVEVMSVAEDSSNTKPTDENCSHKLREKSVPTIPLLRPMHGGEADNRKESIVLILPSGYICSLSLFRQWRTLPSDACPNSQPLPSFPYRDTAAK
jgi:hypothetical protein